MRTRDGYSIAMPVFRVRRFRRRLRQRVHGGPPLRPGVRLFDLLVGRARRATGRVTRYPVFLTRLGLRPLWLVTRVLAPRRVELLYVRRARPS
jgi:hypothetical protein